MTHECSLDGSQGVLVVSRRLLWYSVRLLGMLIWYSRWLLFLDGLCCSPSLLKNLQNPSKTTQWIRQV